MAINFRSLQNLFNQQIDQLIGPDGLSSEVIFKFGVTKRNICPNCIFDPNLNKSSGKYKVGGPINFVLGQICPYCNGVGYHGETVEESGNLAIIWDYKKWINFAVTDSPIGKIQTLCDKTYLEKIINCKEMEVVYPSGECQNPTFSLLGQPQPIGLGDQNYLVCMWQKEGS